MLNNVSIRAFLKLTVLSPTNKTSFTPGLWTNIFFDFFYVCEWFKDSVTPSCVFMNTDPNASCNDDRWICAGETVAGSLADQIQEVKTPTKTCPIADDGMIRVFTFNVFVKYNHSPPLPARIHFMVFRRVIGFEFEGVPDFLGK